MYSHDFIFSFVRSHFALFKVILWRLSSLPPIKQEEEDNVLMENRPFYSMCPLPVLAGLPNPARVQLLPDT